MKQKKIIQDILRLYPELKKNKSSLKKTVKFLSTIQPTVKIRQDFRSELWEKLSTLSTLKSDSLDGLTKKPGLFHIFGWLFASLLAFFWLFYVFGDTLFYTSHAPVISEYESEIFDTDTEQNIIWEIQSVNQVSQPSNAIQKSPQTDIPNTIIINEDGASQIDVSQSQRLQVETPDINQESSQDTGFQGGGSTINDSSNTRSFSLDSDESISDDQVSWTEQFDDRGVLQNESSSFSNMSEIYSDSSTDTNVSDEMMINPAAESRMMPMILWDDIQADAISDSVQEITDIEEESYEGVLDEFTLRCDVFWWEVSIRDEIRVCMIGDIVCTEENFLEWVCELGQ